MDSMNNTVVKTCSKCREVKPLDGFYKSKLGKCGLQSSCKVCQIAASTAWQKANPEQANALKKANPERRKLMSAAWDKAHSEERKQRNAVWRKANPEYFKAINAAYQKALPDRIVKQMIFLNSGIPRELIPQELIQAKRVHLQLTRKLKELRA
jgi:hypothetical protein